MHVADYAAPSVERRPARNTLAKTRPLYVRVIFRAIFRNLPAWHSLSVVELSAVTTWQSNFQIHSAMLLLRWRAMRIIWTAFVAGLITAAVHAEDPATGLERFLEREEPQLVQYRAIRRLEARNERFNVSGWLEACTELQPDGAFAFRVLAEGGSGYIRRRVLRKALETEREAWSTGEVQRSALTAQNYEFQPLAEDTLDAVKVALKPLRKDRMLVVGTMLLARTDGDLLQLDGRLAKNPSFWTNRVDVHRTYARIGGVRMPVALESTAHVRIAGPSTFRMTYQYLAVNGQSVSAQDDRCP